MNSFDFKEIEKLRNNLRKFAEKSPDTVMKIGNEIEQRILRGAIKNTPVGDYEDTYELQSNGEYVKSSKHGGTLKKGWTAEAMHRRGNVLTGKVFNTVPYAVYVEYGHRQTPGRFVPAIKKKLTQGWVEGRFMLTKTLKEVDRKVPGIIKKYTENMFREE